MPQPERLTATAVGFSLTAPYVIAIGEMGTSPAIFPNDAIGGLVLGSVVLRAFLAFAYGRLRRAEASTLVVLCCSDFVLFIGLLALSSLTGDVQDLQIELALIGAWMGSALLVYPSLAIFRIVRGIESNARRAGIIPSAYITFALVASLEGALAGGISGVGLGGLAVGVFGFMRAGGVSVHNPLLAGFTALTITSLLGYATAVGLAPSKIPVTKALLLAVMAAFAAAGISFLASGGSPSWEALGAPSLVIVGLAWWLGREG